MRGRLSRRRDGVEAQWNLNHLGVLIPEADKEPPMNATDIYEAEGRADCCLPGLKF